MSDVRHVTVEAAACGQRIDNYLARLLRKLPRSRIYRMLRSGEVRVDGHRVKPAFRLAGGETVRIPPVTVAQAAQARPPRAVIESLQRRIVHSGSDFLVLDKPAGLAVHAGSGVAFGVIDALRAAASGDGATFLELVHRLDRDTSGLLLVAKNPRSLKELQEIFKQRRIEKTYRLLVHGRWAATARRVDASLLRTVTPGGERRVRVDESAGQSAVTNFRLVEAGDRVSTLDASLLTGRTHQIRVHATTTGFPLVGDSKYGETTTAEDEVDRAAGRLCLHARELRFDFSGRSHHFQSPVPAVFAALQARFGGGAA
ncbi:MAG: RluA family pseudouridine synthase [Pseudomonadales bacterium]|nr:RluA family pseudouridine synthase [Pseudomonadales bacterium]MCP5184875.1 RluA family pseudouridine synthase [Pseudomonadales bacterium]